MSPIIEIQNISKEFPARRGFRDLRGKGGLGDWIRGKKSGTFCALRNISLNVEAGETRDEYVARQFSNVVLASDAFFPFDDSAVAAHSWGIRYLVQPGGSIRDDEVVATCDKLGIAMALTGMRHFTH